MYIGELSPPMARSEWNVKTISNHNRHSCCSVYDLRQLIGTTELWPYLIEITTVPFFISCICYSPIPKSRWFLLIDRGRKDTMRNNGIV